MLSKIKRFINNFKIVRNLETLPGHFYSPIVMPDELIDNQDRIFSTKERTIPQIDINEEKQLNTLKSFLPFYNTLPFSPNKKDGLRYYYDNNFFSYNSGIELFCMIRKFSPKRIIEIGSGFSSALMLDTNELFYNGSIKLIFIEPYPQDRLYQLLKSNDSINNCVIYDKKVQEVGLSVFSELEANDILFVDSSHVSKTGSDLNTIIFEILPLLAKGVIVHFHDVFYPFEYPKNWAMKKGGFGWNEIYLLRAFLMYNKEWEILFFNSFIETKYYDWVKVNMPLCLEKQGGSLYIVKK